MQLLLTRRTIPVLLLVACGDSEPDLATRMELAVRQVDRTIADLPLRADGSSGTRFQIVIDARIHTVGLHAAEGGEWFGYVRDAILLEDGSVVAGDLKRDQLFAISPDGNRVMPFGRPGEGPEEFGEISALIPTGDRTFVLNDNGLQRQSRFELLPAGLRLVESRPFGTYANDVCQGSEGLIALEYDYQTQQPLHHLTSKGKRERGFGLPLVPGSNSLNSSAAQGRILCLPEVRRVMFASSRGDLILFDEATGESIWRRRIADFEPVLLEQKGEGGVLFTYYPPPDFRSMYPAALIRLNDSLGLLQLVVQSRGPKVDGRYTSVQTSDARIIDLSTGAVVGRQSDLPVVIDTRDSLALIKGDDPEPWLGVARFRIVQVP